MIDGPMMLRMSTFSSPHAGEWLRTNDWKRKTKARRKISRPRRCTIRTAAVVSPIRRAFEPADIATAIPAMNRNSGAPNPPRISELPNACDPAVGDARPAVDDVRLDHDQHGHAAQHVEIRPPARSGRLGHRAMLADCSQPTLPSEMVVVNAMSWRMECQTEQYLSCDRSMAR